MISPEEALTTLVEASHLLINAATEGRPVHLDAAQTACLAGAMLNLTRAASFAADLAERN